MLILSYVINDRTTADKWAISIADGQLKIDTTSDSVSAEPVLQDIVNKSDYYKLFIDNGEIGWETTAPVTTTEIILVDTVVKTTYYELTISTGEFSWISVSLPVEAVDITAYPTSKQRIELRNKSFELIKVLTKDVSKLSWEYNRIGGYGRCTLVLPVDYQALDSFMNPDFDIQIYLPNENDNGENLVYRGYAESYRPVTLNPDRVTLQFFGYVGQLKRIRINKTYTSQDVNSIVKDIIENFVAADTKILYDESLIAGPSFMIDTITFDDLANNALKTLADLSGAIEWGVGSDRKFFFKQRENTIKHYTRFKIDINKLDIINDYSTIINRLIIKGGSSFEDTVNNTESQNNFGLRTQITSNNAITTASVSQQYGTSILLDKATINSRASLSLLKNRKLFEETVPIGRISILTKVVARAKLYNDTDAIYGKISYGGQQSYQIEKIKYRLSSGGTNITMNVGQAMPDIALQIKRLEFEIDQIRNS